MLSMLAWPRSTFESIVEGCRSFPPQWLVHQRVWDTVKKNGYLGLTCFGGPPVHFQIFHHRFVERYQWLDEKVFQELFAVTQALPGPASTKLLYCINLSHDGVISAIAAFLLWSLPGAMGMYTLSLGVSQIGDVLPAPAYALLSGLNAATVGVIALAAVQLSQKAVTDRVTRGLVFLGASAGMLYSALWFFPLLILLAGLITITWDLRWLHDLFERALAVAQGIRRTPQGPDVEMITVTEVPQVGESESGNTVLGHMINTDVRSSADMARLHIASLSQSTEVSTLSTAPRNASTDSEARQSPRPISLDCTSKVSWECGTILIVGFLVTFVAVMVVRGVIKYRPILFSLFSNMYLAGTIIFGGGPVVVPLLRQYIVTEGWVSSRDFLLGLAIIQSFPGPSFNFAVYLGSLTATNASLPSFAGALIGYVAIFAPGLILVHGTMGLWRALRARRWVKSSLRGINAAAIGFIYTAVYRLWEIGYVDAEFPSGSSLGRDPWWVVITAATYVGVYWFGMPVPVAILLGGTMGLVRYGVVSS